MNLSFILSRDNYVPPPMHRRMTLFLSLFGTPKIYLDHEFSLRFRTRKAQALLIYLAVTERTWSRDSLATLFWPETSDTTARKNLRDILPSLRRQLGDYLLLDDETIGLDPASQYKCDVSQFSTVLDRGLQSVDSDILVGIMALYRGEFLEGYATSRISTDFELWTLRERERLHQLAMMGFTTLCRRQQENGAYEAALTTNRQLLKLAPWDEDAHQQQMLLLHQSGQRAAAVAHFEICRQLLADELDVEPAAETIALYQRMLSGEHQQTARITFAKQATNLDHADRIPTCAEIPHNLPAALNALIGYAEELTYIQTQLVDNNCRLLTLVGMGGVGKTHLALAAARQLVKAPGAQTRFVDGIYFVALDEIAEAATAKAAEIATTLAIANVLGYTLRGNIPPQQQLQAALANKKMLLILDNVEHLVEGAQLITTLLQGAGALTMLTTSRESLNLRGEYLLELQGLLPSSTVSSTGNRAPAQDIPGAWTQTGSTEGSIRQTPNALWHGSDAVALFAYHAQLANRHFCVDDENITHILRICQLIDGLPLGIEMAAKWLDFLDCGAIADEIAQNLDVLAATQRDLPNRHQTLRAVFDHSWRLLDSAQQMILAQLSIFQPNFSLAAAAVVAEASPRELALLSRKSLLLHNTDRSFTIHRSIRHFAREKLDQDAHERHAVEIRYGTFYLGCLTKLALTSTSAESSQIEAELLKDRANVHLAISLAVQKNMWTELRTTTNAIYYLYDTQGWYLEGADLYEHAAKQLMAYPPPTSAIEEQLLDALLGDLLAHQGWFETRLGHFAVALSLQQRSLELVRRVWANIIADTTTIHTHRHEESARRYVNQVLGTSLSSYGWMELIRGQPKTALALLHESIPLVQDRIYHSGALCGLAYGMYQLGNYQEAEKYAQAALASAHPQGISRHKIQALSTLAGIEQAQGRYAAAEQLYLQCYQLRGEANEQAALVFTLRDLGGIMRLQGKYHLSAEYLHRGLALATKMSSIPGQIQLLWALGNLALQQDDFTDAKAQLCASQRLQHFNHLTAGLPTLGWVHIALAELTEAEHYFLNVVQAVQPFSAYGHLLEALAGLILLQHIAGEQAEPANHLSLIEQHPATMQETKERVRKMYALALSATFAVHRATYHASPALGQTIEGIIALLQQPVETTTAGSHSTERLPVH